MESHKRKDYLYNVLVRQPTNPISMQIIRNSKKLLNERFGTHCKSMNRINNALRELEKQGKIKRNLIMSKVVSKKHPKGIDVPLIYSITVLNKPVDIKKKQQYHA